MNFILDTNVISEFVAPKPNESLLRWLRAIDAEHVFLTVITVGEIKKGIEKLPASPRKDALNHWLNDDLLVRFQGHILEIDVETAVLWGDLSARLQALGRPMGAVDSLLAAIALKWEFTLVTRNTDDFIHSGVKLLNPWNS